MNPDRLSLIISIGSAIFAIGQFYGVVRIRQNNQDKKIEELEKRLDSGDQRFLGLDDKLGCIKEALAGISAKIEMILSKQ